jgi:putative DNA methylase
MNAARDILLRSYGGRPPQVLDIFGGGGTIALEAARLGCRAFSLDINPLAYFIQCTLLRYSQAHPSLVELVRKYGERLLNELERDTKHFYQRNRRDNPRLAFFWGRAVRCSNPSCAKVISLSRLRWLSKKKGRKVLFGLRPDSTKGRYVRELHFNPSTDLSYERWQTTRGISCPFCRRTYTKEELQELTRSTLHDILLCICSTRGHIKDYALPDSQDDLLWMEGELRREIALDLERIGCPLPSTTLPRWSGIVNPALYGITTHVDMFNLRQLAVLLKTIRKLRDAHATLVASGLSKEAAIAVTSALSGLVDQLVDWNCRLTMWIPQNEQVGRALAGPGLPMLWDYVEIDPCSTGPANLYAKLDRIIEALRAIPRFSFPVEVHLGSATNLPFPDETFDAVVTDPPYADNLFYSVLSDCIFVWKRMIFHDILPEIFGPIQVPHAEEIVASHHRHASYTQALNFYEERIGKAIGEAARVLRSEGVLSLFFSHSTIEAWEIIVRAFRRAKLVIRACWPLTLERRARPRGMTSKAVDVSVVIVARKASEPLQKRDWKWVKAQIGQEVSRLIHELGPMQWEEADLGLACFAKAVSVIAACEAVYESNRLLPLRECLERAFAQIATSLPSFSLQSRSGP